MDLDENWYKGGMAKDIYEELLNEENFLMDYNARSIWLTHRRTLVDWIISTGTNIGMCCQNKKKQPIRLCSSTLHLAIYLFDSYLDSRIVSYEKLVLIAATAIVLAAKVEEQFCDIPKFSALRLPVAAFGKQYEIYQFVQVEKDMLLMCDWRLLVPTAPHFSPYYLNVALSDDSFMDNRFPSPNYSPFPPLPIEPQTPTANRLGGPRNPIMITDDSPILFDTPGQCPNTPISPSKEKCENMKKLETLTIYFLELSLKSVDLRYFKPSIVAASCVALSRAQLPCIGPRWTNTLEEASGITDEDLDSCIAELRNFWQEESRPRTLASPVMLPTPAASPLPVVQSPTLYQTAMWHNFPDMPQYVAVPTNMSLVRLPTPPNWHPNAHYQIVPRNYVIKSNQLGTERITMILANKPTQSVTPVTNGLKRHAVSSDSGKKVVKRSRLAAARGVN